MDKHRGPYIKSPGVEKEGRNKREFGIKLGSEFD
jgi:hypothetical protein